MNLLPGLIRGRRTLINLLRELPITMRSPHPTVMDEGSVVADGLTIEILVNEE